MKEFDRLREILGNAFVSWRSHIEDINDCEIEFLRCPEKSKWESLKAEVKELLPKIEEKLNG